MIKNHRIKKNTPIILILLISLIFLKLQANKHDIASSDVCQNICSDGRGYYAWLPAMFIYHDLNFNFFDTVETKGICGGTVGGCLQDYRISVFDHKHNKYYPGTSFMMLPFFAIAHIVTLITDPASAIGYAPLYFFFIGVAGIFFYCIGMLFCMRILQKLRLNYWQVMIALILLTFGSNAMYFSVDKPSYSHIYSFALIAAFLYYTLCLNDKFSKRHLAYLAFLLGWIFITRPINISIAFILPFLFRDQLSTIMANIRQNPVMLRPVLPLLIMPFILLVLYKISTDHFLIYSYGTESFNFLRPHIFNFLFSYDNGVFPYTPLLLVSAALALAWRKAADKSILYGTAITLLITVYLHSSWWCWWYGLSFGARTMLDFLPLFAILVGLSLKHAGKRIYYLVPVYVVCCGITILLYHQKHHGFMNDYPIKDYWKALFFI